MYVRSTRLPGKPRSAVKLHHMIYTVGMHGTMPESIEVQNFELVLCQKAVGTSRVGNIGSPVVLALFLLTVPRKRYVKEKFSVLSSITIPFHLISICS